ncbi:hypothetical protein [Arthrobacter sp. efr-133-TYG-104]|uniref:hypothetical protein n=1 Tax=Arthrobacter sp. efr-133-TYG-104 TaxID=3040324 RepID=UPI00254F48CC|nr:hypothetical protein [Arthrobacter sp. efr-133-TYG-104]
MDLRDAAQQLYTVLPRDFTAERAALSRKAKDAGDKDVAKKIAGLAKPAASAWAVNILAVHKPEVIDGVARFGASLRDAQAESDTEAFRELSQHRQGQLTSAVHAAKDLAHELGAPLSAAAAADVEQTFRAAMADAGAARAVSTGRLVRALSGNGFDPVDLTGAIAAGGPEDAIDAGFDAGETVPSKGQVAKKQAAKEPSAGTAPRPAHEPREQATSLAERRAAKRAAARKEAQDHFASADRVARDTEEAASKAWDVVKELASRRSGVEAEIRDLKKRLAALEAHLIGITRDAESAEADKKVAVRAATEHRRTADQAQRRVDRLS